jgi:hypothetical protein
MSFIIYRPCVALGSFACTVRGNILQSLLMKSCFSLTLRLSWQMRSIGGPRVRKFPPRHEPLGGARRPSKRVTPLPLPSLPSLPDPEPAVAIAVTTTKRMAPFVPRLPLSLPPPTPSSTRGDRFACLRAFALGTCRGSRMLRRTRRGASSSP